jgi:DNA-binding beta-propeller fold protein YncE
MRRALLTAAIAAALAAPAAAPAQTPPPTRDVLVVSNNWAGTADVVDPTTFKTLKRINVIPDRAQREAEIAADPVALAYFHLIRQQVGEGHDQYVDDGFTSPDGRTVYFSRPSFADVVAIDLNTGAIRWRTKVDGHRADHMAISKDGSRLLVSASTANVIEVIDTATGAIVAQIPSGD